MSLAIKIQGDTSYRYIWYVGGDTEMPKFTAESVTSIQADGDELEHIKTMFTAHNAIPIPRGRSVKFYGETAQMIVGNLDNN